MSEPEHTLLVSFPDQSEAFALGFEAGLLWNRIESDESEIMATTRIENREVIERMADAANFDVECYPTDVEGWDETRLKKAKRPRLTLVKGQSH